MIYYTFYNINPTFRREADSLIDRGDQVDVICLRNIDEKKFESVKSANVHRIMLRSFNETKPMHYFGKLVKFFILSTFLVTKLHRQKRYDVIHITSPPDFMVFTSIIPKCFGAKVILDIHDIVPEFYQRKFFVSNYHPIVIILKWIEKISTRFADHIFTVTDIWKKKLSRRSIPEAKCSVLLNAPDSKIFFRRNSLTSSNCKTFRLVYHGSLREHFGVETAVRAMEKISEDIPTARMDIYGFGNQKDYLCRIANHMNLEKCISFNNSIPSDAIPDLIEQCDVGIVPTYDGVFACEALSVKSLEYMAMQVPIVISRTIVTKYYYDDSMVMFFKPGNQKDLARAVIELYRNPEKRKELIRNASLFIQKHSWEYYKKVYYRVIDNLNSKP